MANVVAVKRRERTAGEVSEILDRYSLSFPQRLAIRALMGTATRTEALKLLADHGYEIDKSTLSRWYRSKPFRMAMEHAEAAFARTITKPNLLRKSEAVFEKAMEGAPIIGTVLDENGEEVDAVIGRRPDLPSAARLIETQGKLIGAFADESATKIAILVDVDFSGRKDAPPADAIDVPFVEVPPAEGDSWLD